MTSTRNGKQRERKRLPQYDETLTRGLMYVHEAIGTRIVKHEQLAAHVYALTELLIAKGLVSLQEVEARKEAATERMMSDTLTHWEGARVLTDGRDKYAAAREVAVDCESRLHLCKAACCRLSFYLSKQDLSEGIVRWDVGRPYHVAQREDGLCVHCDEETKRCDVHANRPMTCREYDCRTDERIWIDFEKRMPNRALEELE